MKRNEILQDLLDTVEMLNTRQLREAKLLIEELAYPERATDRQHTTPPASKGGQSYGNFIAELSKKLRTGGTVT